MDFPMSLNFLENNGDEPRTENNDTPLEQIDSDIHCMLAWAARGTG